MSERVVKHSDKHPIVNQILFAQTSLEPKALVCLSYRDVFIIRSYLWPYVEWRTRLAKPVYGDYWELSTDEELSEFIQACHELDSKIGVRNVDCINSGLTEIANAVKEAFGQIAISMANCCDHGSGSGGQGTTAPPINPTEINEPGAGDPPSGFDSWEQWYANKCSVAADIVQTMIGDVGRMSTVNLIGVTLVSAAAGLVPVILSPIPFDDILVIAGLLVVAIGFGGAMLSSIKAVLENNEDELVCVLYNSTSSASAKAEFVAKYFQFWDDDGHSSIFSVSASGIINSFLNPANTNRLFTLETGRTLPEHDCSGCTTCGMFYETESAQAYEDWTEFNFGDELVPYLSPDYYDTIDAYVLVVSFDVLRDVEIEVDGFTPWSGTYTTRAGTTVCANAAGEMTVIGSEELITTLSGVGNITLASTTPFTAVITEV